MRRRAASHAAAMLAALQRLRAAAGALAPLVFLQGTVCEPPRIVDARGLLRTVRNVVLGAALLIVLPMVLMAMLMALMPLLVLLVLLTIFVPPLGSMFGSLLVLPFRVLAALRPSSRVPRQVHNVVFRVDSRGGGKAEVELHGHEAGVDLGDEVVAMGIRWGGRFHAWRVQNVATGVTLYSRGLAGLAGAAMLCFLALGAVM